MLRRAAWLAAGWAALAVGSVGIFLPLLPTVPFVILACFCFARSSPALERRLLDHPRFGPPIAAWRERRAISRRGKWAATAAFAASAILGMAMLTLPWSLVPAAVAVAGTSWIWTRAE